MFNQLGRSPLLLGITNLSLQSRLICSVPRALRQGQRHFSSTTPRLVQYVRFDDRQPSGSDTQWGSQYRRYWNQWDRRLRVIVILGVLTGVYYFAHLEQVPETGRLRFMNTSPQFEAKFGELARAQVRRELRDEILPYNHPTSRRIQGVVQRILSSNNLGSVKGVGGETNIGPQNNGFDGSGGEIWDPDSERRTSSSTDIGPEKEWDVIVVNDPKMINAMAVPGMIVVFTGIISVCKNDEGLSAVLSHEIGHVVARHSAERISSQTIMISFLLLMRLIGVDFGLSGIMKDLMLELPNSRVQEREADYIGLKLMSRACFDPKAAPKMFERLDKIESETGSKFNFDFLQTHPSSKSRVEYLQQLLPEAYGIRESTAGCAELEEKVHEFLDGVRVMVDRN